MTVYLEIELEVDADYYPEYKGYCNPVKGIYEPPEEEHISINAINYNGKDIYDLLTQKDFDKIEQDCLEQTRNERSERLYAEYEWRRDQQREAA